MAAYVTRDERRLFILVVVLPVVFFWALLAFAPPSQAIGWGQRLTYGAFFGGFWGSVGWLRVRNR